MTQALDLNGIQIERGDIVYVHGRRNENNFPIEYEALDIQKANLGNGEYLTYVVVFNRSDSSSQGESVDPKDIEVSPYSLAHRKALAGLLSITELRDACVDEMTKAANFAVKVANVDAEVVVHYGSFTHVITIRDAKTKETLTTTDVYIDKDFLSQKRHALAVSYCPEGFIDIVSDFFKNKLLERKS